MTGLKDDLHTVGADGRLTFGALPIMRWLICSMSASLGMRGASGIGGALNM